MMFCVIKYCLVPFILTGFLHFADGFSLGNVTHTGRNHTGQTDWELMNATRYCGNGYYMYLSKLIDTRIPQQLEDWDRDYEDRECSTKVVNDTIIVNQTMFFEIYDNNVTWTTVYQFNNTHYFLIFENFELLNDTEGNNGTNQTSPTTSNSTAEQQHTAIHNLRNHFMPCINGMCLFDGRGVFEFDAVQECSNGERMIQFALHKNSLLEENPHLTKVYGLSSSKSIRDTSNRFDEEYPQANDNNSNILGSQSGTVKEEQENEKHRSKRYGRKRQKGKKSPPTEIP